MHPSYPDHHHPAEISSRPSKQPQGLNHRLSRLLGNASEILERLDEAESARARVSELIHGRSAEKAVSPEELRAARSAATGSSPDPETSLETLDTYLCRILEHVTVLRDRIADDI